MGLLEEKLLNLTEEFKNDYLKRVADWAIDQRNQLIKMTSFSQKQWCELLGIESEKKKMYDGTEVYGFPRGFFNQKISRKYDTMRKNAYKAKALSEEEFVNKEVQKAEAHYLSSIAKMAERIESKGLDVSKLEVEYARLGVNFEAVITDGIKKVRAFTIVASGEVQRPHYRYLIK